VALSVENLFALSEGTVGPVAQATFQQLVKLSPSVVDFFFPDPAQRPDRTFSPGTVIAPNGTIHSRIPDLLDSIGAALLCSSIGRSSLYGFSKTVDLAKSDKYWTDALASAPVIDESRWLYDSYFPFECSDPELFIQYMNDGAAKWGAALATHITTPNMINLIGSQQSILQAGWSRWVNVILYKLHRLDDSQVSRVLETWKAGGLAVAKEWDAYRYVPAFTAGSFLDVMNAVIAERAKDFSPGHGQGGGDTTYTFGSRVVAFLGGKPKALGLTTGVPPDNIEEHHRTHGCFLAGTLVLLAGGDSKPIEDVTEGDAVIAENGEISVRSDEDVVIPLEEGEVLYGINDIAPFFSAGHLFLTETGWKAIDPATALEENPTGRLVDRLTVGDVVFRVASSSPFTYERVAIERLTTRALPAGAAIHGLHLLGARSYHANGFCVAMNYPLITARRLAQGFATLSQAERELLLRQLDPVMPLLRKALGRFVEAPLRYALRS
jgi:hypothetical protein